MRRQTLPDHLDATHVNAGGNAGTNDLKNESQRDELVDVGLSVSDTLRASVEAAVRLGLTENPAKSLTATQLAAHLSMSPVALRRRLKRVGVPSLRTLISSARLNHAADLIRQGTKVEAAMILSGLHHRSHFSRLCRRHFHCLPHELSSEESRLSRERSNQLSNLGPVLTSLRTLRKEPEDR